MDEPYSSLCANSRQIAKTTLDSLDLSSINIDTQLMQGCCADYVATSTVSLTIPFLGDCFLD